MRRRGGMIWLITFTTLALVLPSSAVAYQDAWASLAPFPGQAAGLSGIIPNLACSRFILVGGASGDTSYGLSVSEYHENAARR